MLLSFLSNERLRVTELVTRIEIMTNLCITDIALDHYCSQQYFR